MAYRVIGHQFKQHRLSLLLLGTGARGIAGSRHREAFLTKERVRWQFIATTLTPYAVVGLHLVACSWYLLTDM